MEKFVSQILEKFSNYQFMNNLIPGALFCVILPLLTRYDLMGDNMWFNLAIVYFSGIVMSRFGSIVIEELFKKWHIVTFESYPRYIDASAKDEFIKTLSMENNMYRTFISLFVLLLLSKLSDWLASVWVFGDKNIAWILCIIMLSIFIGAYIKQTRTIVKRIKKQLDNNQQILFVCQ